MPRSFSSGALSISSKLFASPPIFSDSTWVIAAVSVVFPWSMCPIVPTFTCGLFRSNFSFATPSYSFLKAFAGAAPDATAPAKARTSETYSLSTGAYGLPGPVLDDLLLDARRHLVVAVELHGVSGPTLCGRAQVGRVAEHLGERDAGPNGDGVAARLLALHTPTAAREVADDRSDELLRRDDLHGHDRLKQHGMGALRGLLERQRARNLEGHLRRVRVVVLAVDERRADVHHRDRKSVGS